MGQEYLPGDEPDGSAQVFVACSANDKILRCA